MYSGRILRRSVWLPALAFVFLVFTAPDLSAAEYSHGDACSNAGAYHTKNSTSAVVKLVCDGSNWNRVTENDTSGNFGVKQTAPKATLHIGG